MLLIPVEFPPVVFPGGGLHSIWGLGGLGGTDLLHMILAFLNSSKSENRLESAFLSEHTRKHVET